MKKSKIHILKEDMKIHIFFFLRKYSWIGCGFMLARIQKGIQKIAEAGLFALLFFAWYSLENEIPGEINVIAGEEGQFNFDVPVTFTVEDEVQDVFDNMAPVTEGNPSEYTMTCKLFGVIPVKQVDVHVVEEEQVIPGGLPIGIYVKTDGILVIGTGSISGADGISHEPAAALLKSGDYICSVNGEAVSDKKELTRRINDCGAEKLDLGIRRKDEQIDVFVTPVLSEDGAYKLGIWVRDDLAGIGTMTYLTDELFYGALGHGVNDADTSSLLTMRAGSLYQTDIVDIVKGEHGTPGELTGVINYRKEYYLGNIDNNSEVGIHGKLDQIPVQLADVPAVLVGHKQEIGVGRADIICELNGKRKNYEIEITEVNYSETKEKREIVFEVTDPELLATTGGIVQGMSGAPILQDGKMIGAVTHVYINNPTKGYGIFIEEMLK